MRFYGWIKDSIAKGKPYNQMATELIAATADNTYDDGPSNFLVVRCHHGPVQDIMDQMTASTFETFLGVTHVNCVLCHNGRGHLDGINLWGMQTTRYQAWQLASICRAPARRALRWTRATPISTTGACSQSEELHHGLHAEHDHRQPSGADCARRVQGRTALLHGDATVHL